jgi:hypothetical protein
MKFESISIYNLVFKSCSLWIRHPITYLTTGCALATSLLALFLGYLLALVETRQKFFIPINFVVCDMKEDPYIPIILGCPFLITAGAKIDVKCEKISLNFGKDKVEFCAIKINDNTLNNDSYCRVEVFNTLTEEKHNEIMKEKSKK